MTNEPTQADTSWSIETALDQIRKCEFECEGGPLANNTAWQWLEIAAKNGPKFWPGQSVWYQVKAATPAGKVYPFWEKFVVVGCSMSASDTGRYWTYMLSQDPPSAYHYGEVYYNGVREVDLHDEKPVSA